MRCCCRLAARYERAAAFPARPELDVPHGHPVCYWPWSARTSSGMPLHWQLTSREARLVQPDSHGADVSALCDGTTRHAQTRTDPLRPGRQRHRVGSLRARHYAPSAASSPRFPRRSPSARSRWRTVRSSGDSWRSPVPWTARSTSPPTAVGAPPGAALIMRKMMMNPDSIRFASDLP